MIIHNNYFYACSISFIKIVKESNIINVKKYLLLLLKKINNSQKTCVVLLEPRLFVSCGRDLIVKALLIILFFCTWFAFLVTFTFILKFSTILAKKNFSRKKKHSYLWFLGVA